MITHGIKAERYTREIRAEVEVVRGYYLVLPNGDAHWLGTRFDEARRNLEAVSSRYLNEKNGYHYWIDYCFGYDVDGRLAWQNLDLVDDFL